MELSHVDKNGSAKMVDVGNKDITVRVARAGAKIKMKSETLSVIKDNTAAKGDVLAAARIAGIQAGKRTWELIPLCHNLPIDKIDVSFEFEGDDTLVINSFAKCGYKTGIEMEALTAVSVAALCVYDMCKAADKTMVIGDIRLVSKSGGTKL